MNIESLDIDAKNGFYKIVKDNQFNGDPKLKELVVLKNDIKNLPLGSELETKIVLSDDLTIIGEKAFYKCEHLSTVELPYGANLGVSSFESCLSLSNVLFSIVSCFTEKLTSSIGDKAFANCHMLREVVSPDNLEKIGNGAFYDCIGLKKIIIPANVGEIGRGAFYGCCGLEKITFLGETKLANDTFEDCNNLKTVIVPTRTIDYYMQLFHNQINCNPVIEENKQYNVSAIQ